MDTKVMKRIVYGHLLWFSSDGKAGSCVDLAEADLREIDLSEADLNEVDLRGLNFNETNLKKANLKKADLSEANLRKVDISEADLSEANLRKADISAANLRGADLSEADLSEANLKKADLREANLTGANFQMVDLSEADLTGANLTGAFLEMAALSEADLTGADLTGTMCLTQSQLDSADGDSRTQIPADLQRPEHWLKAQPKPPKIPDPSPAPIRTTVRDNKVVLDAVEAESPAAKADRELHWNELRDQSARLQNNASNHPQIQLTLERYADGLGASLADMQPILLGLRGVGLQELVKKIDEVMPSDSAAPFHTLSILHQLFMQQFPEWQEYTHRGQEQPLSKQQRQAVKDVAPEIIQATRAQPSIIDQAIPETIDSLHQQANESRDPLVRKGVFDSLRNMLVSVAGLIVDKAKNELARQALKLAVALLIPLVDNKITSILIDLFPDELGWLEDLRDYLRKHHPEE